ncbi:MAG: FlgD immunoglobulin-like domain containing protein [Pseudomonadota bacterium]
MSIEGSGNLTLNNISSSYTAKTTDKEEDTLGREAFLTMLVAQLQNQDPLNPMQGSDFSAQLAQFSSLEQLINLNDTLKEMSQAFENSSKTDGTEFIGKQVVGNANSVDVASGQASTGYYTLSDPSDVMVTIYNESGNAVRTLFPGQQKAGTYAIGWDGTDNGGNKVDDGTYTYQVMANSGYGFTEVSTAVSGTVEGITYNNGKTYLVVNGMMISPDSLLQVTDAAKSQETTSAVDYLGNKVTTSNPLAYIEGDYISGNTISFDLDAPEDVSVVVKNSAGSVIRNITLPADSMLAGTNTVAWDGTDGSGNAVADGLYSFSVSSESGARDISVTAQVAGIKYLSGAQYLVLDSNGVLAAMSSVTGVN